MKYSIEDEEDNEFLNKKIIVTGASSGIGLTVALYFLNCGAQVILAGQDIDTMKRVCERYKFSNATIMELHLSNDISIYDFKTSVVERFKTIDILINCAGVKFDGDVEKTYPQDFDYTLDVNLRAVYYLIYNLSGFMNKKGCIINMSCLYGSKPMSGMISYTVSKAGLESLTRYIAAEFAPIGIRVNAVTSCPVETNSMRLVKVPESEIEYFNEKMKKNIPLGRIARPDDITKVIAFLASERSKNITGQIIKVDGGRALTSSGYIHYKGIKNMNTRFEPDEVKASSWFENLFNFNFGERNIEIPKGERELKKFIDEKIKESNFSTNLDDAHKNNSVYKSVDINDQKLKEKYLKGKNPNPLYDLREKNQNNYGRTAFGSTNQNIYNDTYQNRNPTGQNMSYNINNNYSNQTDQINRKREEPPDSQPKYKVNTNPFPNYNNNQNFYYEDE